MSASKTRAGSRKGAGSSSSNGHKTFKFKNVSLTVANEMPDTIYYDLGEINLLAADQDIRALSAVRRVLHSLLGEEEMLKVRGVIKSPQDEMALLNKVVEASDLNLGEA